MGILTLSAAGRDEYLARNATLPRMTGALEAVDEDGVDAEPLGLQGMAHGGAFVDHLDAVLLQLIDMLLGIVTRRLHDLYAGLDNRLAVLGVRRRLLRLILGLENTHTASLS